jgi:hypothetical protein
MPFGERVTLMDQSTEIYEQLHADHASSAEHAQRPRAADRLVEIILSGMPVRRFLQGNGDMLAWFRDNILVFVSACSPRIFDFRYALTPVPAARQIDTHYHTKATNQHRHRMRQLKKSLDQARSEAQ